MTAQRVPQRSARGGPLADTWAWDGSAWAPLASALRPRSHARMAFDRRLGALLVAGGQPAEGLDVLVARGEAWMALAAGPQPSARDLTDIAYDEARGALVLYGGAAPNGSLLGDTWELGATGWQLRSPSG